MKVQKEKLKWLVEISVDPLWVADGFSLKEEVLKEMVERMLSFSTYEETDVRIVQTPDEKVIAGLQSGAIGFPGDDDGN